MVPGRMPIRAGGCSGPGCPDCSAALLMAWMPHHGGITMCRGDIGERHRGRRDLPLPWYRTARPGLSETATLGEKLAHQAAPAGEFDELFKPSMDLLASLWKILKKVLANSREWYCEWPLQTPPVYHAKSDFELHNHHAVQDVTFSVYLRKSNGAGGGTRTHTGIRPSDFKSDMSTIPSRPHPAPSVKRALGPEQSDPQTNLKQRVSTPCFVCRFSRMHKRFWDRIAHRGAPERGIDLFLCAHSRHRTGCARCSGRRSHRQCGRGAL